MRRLQAATLSVILALALVWGGSPVLWAQQAKKTPPKPAPAKPGAQLEGLDQFIEQVMKDWQVPGLAVAVVKGKEVIYSKGFGYRDVEKKLPVTPQTLFAIGSVTKSFTVTAMGMLVDDGKLDWDRPVREFLPDFRLHDEAATERMTPRDLVTHRSGLPRHDALWYNSVFSREEMYRRLRHLEPSRDFRNNFQYNNLMFMTAGVVVERLSGKKWEAFVREHIFQPLGMATSNFSVKESENAADFSLPYEKAKEEVKRVPFRVIDEVGPAGSINSSVDEMIRYIRFHLNGGRAGETRLLSESNAEQMQSPQMPVPGALRWKEVGHQSYGLGLFVTSYQGRKFVHHGGGIDGFISLLSFMPQEQIGVMVLTNLSPNQLPTIVSYQIYDRLLGLEPVDWNARFLEMRRKGEESEEEAKKKGYTPRKEGTSPSHPLTDYAGNYEHPGYGVARVALKDDGLQLTFNDITTPLRHFHYEVFEAPEDPLNPLEGMKAQFALNLQGDVETLALPLEPNVPAIHFRRVAEAGMRERSFLEPLAGEYELGPTTVTVALKGDDTLMLVVPGQAPYELLPQRGLLFELKGITGFSVEFKKDPGGRVTEFVAYQPNGTFVAKRK